MRYQSKEAFFYGGSLLLKRSLATQFLKVSYASDHHALSSLQNAGILTEITGRKRDKA